jgi:hypothetical protein
MAIENFVQHVQQYEEPSRLKQLLFNFLDIVLCYLAIAILLVYRTPIEIYQLVNGFNSTLCVLALIVVYRTCCLLLFGQTVGMKIFRVVLRNGLEKELTIKERLLASSFILYKGVAYYKAKVIS